MTLSACLYVPSPHSHFSLDIGTDLPHYDKPTTLPKQSRFGGLNDDDFSDAGSSDNEERYW